MKKKEFYKIMEVCGIDGCLRDTDNNYYYKWKDADLIFVVHNEEQNSVSTKVLGEISYDFIVGFRKKYSNGVILTSDVVDENSDNKYFSYAVMSNLKNLLRFILEMKDYLAENKENKDCEISKYEELLEKIAPEQEQDFFIHDRDRVYANAIELNKKRPRGRSAVERQINLDREEKEKERRKRFMKKHRLNRGIYG